MTELMPAAKKGTPPAPACRARAWPAAAPAWPTDAEAGASQTASLRLRACLKPPAQLCLHS